MSYISKNLQSPDVKSEIEEKWISIKAEKISKDEKTKKWRDYVYELEKIGTITEKVSIYLINNYRM